MKKFKKIMAVLVAAMMIMTSMTITAFAAATDYQIVIKNALAGETYTAYKIFDLTDAAEGVGDPNQHTYVVASGTFDRDTKYYTRSAITSPEGTTITSTRWITQ